MADAADRESRTEEPTQRRVQEALDEGNVPQSAELTGALALLAAIVALSRGGGHALSGMVEVVRERLGAITIDDITPATIAGLSAGLGWRVGSLVLPLVAATGLVGITASIAQSGFRLRTKAIIPDLQKISPAAGLQRLFSSRGLGELVKALLKLGIVGWLTWGTLRAAAPMIVSLPMQPPRDILATAGEELRGLGVRVIVAILIIAILDTLWQRRNHRRDLMMTKQEVKEEHKQSEPNPQMKSRIRKSYSRIARARMIDAVRTADVVVTNPTHVAVALRYSSGEMAAPRVVAKGAELMAQRIKDVARQNGVPILERRALARALFRSVPVGGEIPEALYRAVAEILAFVFSSRARRARAAGA